MADEAYDVDLTIPLPLEGLGRLLRKLREPDAPRAKRVRRPSPRTVEKQAGRPFVSLTDHPDGSHTYAFGQQDAAKEAAAPEEPPRTSLFKARAVPKMKVVL